MKRLVTLGLITATTLFAATDSQLVDYLKSQVRNPALKINIVERNKLKNFEGFDAIVAKITDGKQAQMVNLFTKGDLIFPDIINIKTGESIKQKLEKDALVNNLKSIYKNEDTKYIISLGNDPKKETMVVFTDPECPYCGRELERVEEKLKSTNIKLLMTPVHGRSALVKSFLIYKETAKAKDDATKIAIMKKYYDKNVKITDSVSDKEVQEMENLRKKYLQGGLKGVPFYIAEKEIL